MFRGGDAVGRIARGLRARFPRTQRSRRYARRAFVLAALVYVAILVFPGSLFAYHLEHGAFRIASDAPIDLAMARVLDDAAARIAASPLADPAMVHHVYLCRSGWRWYQLAPTSSGAFGTTRFLLETSVLGRTDIPSNAVFRRATTHNRRSLSGVIAHERMHALIDRRIGPIASLRLPTWKKEGYCDYVAGDTSFPIDEAKRLIREGRSDDSSSFRYARAFLMVKYLLEVEGLSVDELFAASHDEEAVLAKVRADLDRP